jgi:hypothetical protein
MKVWATFDWVEPDNVRAQLNKGQPAQRRSDEGRPFYDLQSFQQLIHRCIFMA